MEKSNKEKFRNLYFQLRHDFGWDIILHDFYGIYGAFPQFDDIRNIEYQWHNNPFCMKIKSNHTLFGHCVKIKDIFLTPKIYKGKSFWGTCYCGVAEYIVPIKVCGTVIADLTVMGYLDDIRPKISDYISKKLNITPTELEALRVTHLKKLNEEEIQRLDIYVRVAADLLIKIAEETVLYEKIQTSEQLSGDTLLLLNAVDFIRKNYEKDISPTSVAKQLNVSLSHIQHIFSRKVGHGIATEIRDYRLYRSAELLYTTEMSVKNIAISVGYLNVDYFSVLFKRSFGISPLEYRKQRNKL